VWETGSVSPFATENQGKCQGKVASAVILMMLLAFCSSCAHRDSSGGGGIDGDSDELNQPTQQHNRTTL